MNLDNINIKLKEMLSLGRMKHSQNVAICAVELSGIYNCDKEKAYLAGVIHDCAKCLTEDESNYYVEKYEIELDSLEKENRALSHSIIGSYIVKNEFEINDEDIINAVKYHTTGKEDMTLLEKIIYISDLIEEGRNFSGIDKLRELAYSGRLDEALLISFNNTIKFVIDNNQLIHPRSIEARNYLMKQNQLLR